ncbi:kinase-like domain-containing protein [Xylaria telfairii]|nr:kinase-like domain-containing protein [Xylaria telfairii]
MPGMQQNAYPFVNTVKDRDEVDIDRISSDWMLDEKLQKPYQCLTDMKKYFTQEYPDLRYNRCLGWGGNGLAAAFDVLNKQGEKIKSVVVKMLFSSDQELQKWERHRYAEHIVQLVYADILGLVDDRVIRDDKTRNRDSPMEDSPDSRDSDSSRNGDRDEEMTDYAVESIVDPTPNVFITEMLENGDLAAFIKKVRQHREQIPNPILWRLLLCLVRMCIGLAYPPAEIPEFKDKPIPITETVPPRLRDNPSRIVHFDIDPKNIFVGDVAQVEGEHTITPLLKLGDFGVASEIKSGQWDFYYERFRQYGKKGYYAPEQFCQDWDYIQPDTDQIQHHPIAGNFGSHTNVWALGYIMENLITTCYPAGPPVPTVSSERPPIGKTQYLTYAAHLQQPFYAHVDRDIIALVLRLQAHLPEDRPPLQEIEDYVLTNIRTKGNYGMTDYNLQAWIQGILYEVPPVMDEEAYAPGPVIKEVIGTGLADPVPDFNFQPQGHAVRPPGVQPQPRGLQEGWRNNGRWVNYRGRPTDNN